MNASIMKHSGRQRSVRIFLCKESSKLVDYEDGLIEVTEEGIVIRRSQIDDNDTFKIGRQRDNVYCTFTHDDAHSYIGKREVKKLDEDSILIQKNK